MIVTSLSQGSPAARPGLDSHARSAGCIRKVLSQEGSRSTCLGLYSHAHSRGLSGGGDRGRLFARGAVRAEEDPFPLPFLRER